MSMIQRKRKAKLLLIIQYHAEALRLGGKISANQQRFLDVAAAHGKDLEPPGLLAGKRV
ncbi:Type II toxin-antitoxin system ParD family antitoxin [Pseudomonas sp. IT-P4]